MSHHYSWPRLSLTLIGLLMVANTAPAQQAAPRRQMRLVQGWATQRAKEKMDRAPVATAMEGGRIYLGWRLLDSDPPATAFNVYRRQGDAQPQRLNDKPITQTTDFVDANPPAGTAVYFIRAVINGQEESDSLPATATPAQQGKPYTSIRLQGNYSADRVAIADLDGDGRYDFVVRQPNANTDPYDQYWKRSTETYKLEAYRSDGALLWVYDMGWAIERGVWYAPFIAYDLDGDGCAEVIVKSGVGDPRDADGKVTRGEEFVTVLDGKTGKVKAQTAWPTRDGFPDYNYYCRNQLGIAYLDGKTPCLLVQRGTYNTIKMVSYDLRQGQLHELWKWNDSLDGPDYRGQGAHALRAADIDEDGRDEVIYGSAVIDDNGVGLWSTKLGHPDHVTIGKLDPALPGLQIHYGLERKMARNGICMVDARTGRLLWSLNEPTSHVHGQGLCADIDPTHPGNECYGGERDFKDKRWLFSARGELLSTKDLGGLAPRAAYWDADGYRQLLIGKRPTRFNGAKLDPLMEGSIIAVADILGDWREEVITTVPGEVRIYSSTIPARDRRLGLMYDRIYRADVSGSSQGYYQIPSLSFSIAGQMQH